MSDQVQIYNFRPIQGESDLNEALRQIADSLYGIGERLKDISGGGGGGGVSDHGALTGLSDDDHSQYHNDARGDARYYTKAQVNTLVPDNLHHGSGVPSSGLGSDGDFYFRSDGGEVQDANWDDVAVLLHMDGDDGSVTFEDEKGHTVTVFGDTQVDTAQSQFGGASALFDGTSDYLSLADSVDYEIGTDDFTIECWFRVNNPATGSVQQLVSRHESSGNALALHLRIHSSGVLQLVCRGGGATVDTLTGATTLSANTWYHAAAVRTGTTLKIFLNGVEDASMTQTATHDLSATNSTPLIIGALDSGTPGDFINGWIDEVRFTSGVARYTADFTVPEEAFEGAAPYIYHKKSGAWEAIDQQLAA